MLSRESQINLKCCQLEEEGKKGIKHLENTDFGDGENGVATETFILATPEVSSFVVKKTRPTADDS